MNKAKTAKMFLNGHEIIGVGSFKMDTFKSNKEADRFRRELEGAYFERYKGLQKHSVFILKDISDYWLNPIFKYMERINAKR